MISRLLCVFVCVLIGEWLFLLLEFALLKLLWNMGFRGNKVEVDVWVIGLQDLNWSSL